MNEENIRKVEIKDIQKNNLVVQSNALIEASYRLSLQEKRLILILTSMINKNDEDFKTYQFKVKDLAKMFGINDNDFYSRVEDITRGLRAKELAIRNKVENRVLYTGWLSSAHYFNNEGYVKLCFDPNLKPYLLNLKEQFTQYALRNIVKFKSVYTIRIYELLRQYFNTEHKTRIFELKDLKAKLGLVEFDKNGSVTKEKLKSYADIKRRILTPAQKELKEKSDISFEFKEIKTGRRVTAVKFLIIKREEIKAVEIAEVVDEKTLPLPLVFSADDENKKDVQDVIKLEKTIIEVRDSEVKDNEGEASDKRDGGQAKTLKEIFQSKPNYMTDDDISVFEFTKVKVDMIVDDILNITQDFKSKKYFYKIAWKFILSKKEQYLHQAISELRADGGDSKNKGAFFVTIIKRLANELKIKL